MAGARLTVNEHWGPPNSNHPGGLWWENMQLKQKAMLAGWKNKKATPWKPSHELLQISLVAHIKDVFCIHCSHPNFQEWAATATFEDFDMATSRVFDKLFTTSALDKLAALPEDTQDTTIQNTVLQNRDSLFYIEFVSTIKKGDISRVMNVL